MHKQGLWWALRRLVAVAGGLALAWVSTVTSADAFIIGFGFPYPGFYAAPWPAYPPPGYYPYYPPPYYPPAPAYYPRSTDTAPTAPASGAAASGMAAITYTDRPAYRNAAGQTCRQYRTPSGALGTACQDASGQWRVAD